MISGRYCCVPDVNIHLIKPHLKFSLHLFIDGHIFFKYFIHQHDSLHVSYFLVKKHQIFKALALSILFISMIICIYIIERFF